MDNILKVIDSVTTDKQVKSIINSLNDNQEKSKNWLIEKSKEYFTFFNRPKVCIAAGWYGSLAYKLKDYIGDCLTRNIDEIITFDKDPQCQVIGEKLYKGITFLTAEIENFNFITYDIVMCTSCEHLEQEVIDGMLKRIRKGVLVILQSNNYFTIKEHINCHNSVEEFEKTLHLEKILYRGSLKLENCDRYMVVGIK
jgi:hypothetical protein